MKNTINVVGILSITPARKHENGRCDVVQTKGCKKKNVQVLVTFTGTWYTASLVPVSLRSSMQM